jgi:amino acid adenylation domain-containing protein
MKEGVPSLLLDLARAGIRLSLAGDDQIQVTAPRGALSAELRDGIARHKPALLDWLRRAGRGDGHAEAELPRIVPDEERLFEPFAPTDLQQAFLIGSREGFEFHVRPHQYIEIDFDELDPVRFEAALNQALRRQRKNLVVVREDMLLQTVRDPGPVEVTVTDLRHLPEAEAREVMLRVRERMQREEPPHDRWPWLRPHISRYGDERARLHYNGNSLFTDAPSGVGLVHTALRHYQDPDQPVPELEISFRDCALALAELEQTPLGQAAKRYWCDRMAGWPGAPELPLVAGAEHRGRSWLSRRELLLPASLWDALKRRAEALGLTLTNALLAAHAEVIAYWSGSRHYLLNNMITHRQLPLHAQMGEVLGNFAALYPLEVDWRHDEPFADRARRLQAQVMADMAHVHWSGAKVLQTLNQVRRTPGRAVCPYAVGSALFVGAGERPFYSLLETPQTLLDTEFWQLSDGRLWVTWDVIEAMFPDGLIDAMLSGYRCLLTALAEDDGAWQRHGFDLLPAGQRARRAALNRSDEPVATGLLHADLARQAARQPDRPAVVTPVATLSYAELHGQANRLASRLHESGVRPGDLVAVTVPKSCPQIVAVLGTLTAGAAYVPIDPAWPEERIRYLLGDTAATAAVTAAGQDPPAGVEGVPVVPVEPGPASAPVPTPEGRPEDLAYVIYTSGSTGRPKGAMLDHRGPRNTVVDINRRFGIGREDVLFGVSSLCFDLSVYDVFGAIEAGATLVLPGAGQTDPASWVETVRDRRVTVWNSVPAIMQLLVEAASSAGIHFPALRTVLLSGDWIPVHLPARIREVAPSARVISLGGATEASIWSICFPIDHQDPGWASIPYGRPLAHQTWHVLDDLGRDAPTWVPGQLYIGGVGVALGYLNDPARTGAAFVRHPSTGEHLYRTGDLGRYLPGGDIEFLGRCDFQVKIQGFRVEPGEVEHALLEHGSVRQAAVVARAAGSGRQLVAFVVGSDQVPAPDPDGLRAFLTGRLPRYLVPSQISVLDRLPLTANGKLDRPALEATGQPGRDGGPGFTPARTPAEATLVEIWESVLATVRPVGVHDDFFDLGGQSFAALRVIGQIGQRLGHRVPLGVLLEQRTIAALAAWIAVPEPSWSPLVRLTKGSGGPWFLVHPAGGNVLCYRGLAESLDRPCYAFQAPGPACGRQPLDKVGAFAGLYLRALLEIRPRGPYSLGGWSSGAVIAAELARQLEELGHRVDQLVVVDAPAPVIGRSVDDTRLLLWFLEDLDIGFDPRRADQGEFEKLAGLPRAERVSRVAQVLANGAGTGSGAAHLDPDELAATLAVFESVVRACTAYTAAMVGADITVLRASDGVVSEFAGHPYTAAPDWGWSGLSTGRTRSQVVPGRHHTLLTDPRALCAVADAFNSR